MLSSYGYHLQNEEDMSQEFMASIKAIAPLRQMTRSRRTSSQSLSLQPLHAKYLTPLSCASLTILATLVPRRASCVNQKGLV